MKSAAIRNGVFGLVLAMMAGGAGAAQAGTLPGTGPDPSWTEMQKVEWYLGYMSKAAAICRYYGKSVDLAQLAKLTPYGRIGLKGITGDGFYGAACQGIGEDADKLLADRAEFIRYFADIYGCSPGAPCTAGIEGDKFASNHACSQKVNEVLENLKIGDGDVESITFRSPPPGPSNGGEAPYQARIRLRSCGGSLFVELSQQCGVKQTYTRGDCQIAGVSGY